MSIDYNAGLIRDLAFCRARIRELDAAVAERDEAIRQKDMVLWEIYNKGMTSSRAHHVRLAESVLPIARAAVDAAKGGTK